MKLNNHILIVAFRYGSVNLNIWLSDLQCSGEEKSLLECPRELSYDLYTFAMLNAGVECTNDTNYTSGKS